MASCPTTTATTTTAAVLLVGLLGAICVRGTTASPALVRGENIPLDTKVFTEPEYVEALAKELEKGGAVAKNEDEVGRLARGSQTGYDNSGFGHNQKFSSHRKVTSTSRPQPSSGTRSSLPMSRRRCRRRGSSSRHDVCPGDPRSRTLGRGFGGPTVVVERPPRRNSIESTHVKEVTLDFRKGYSDSVIFPADLINLVNQKRNFDEIDRSGFSGFNKRDFDEIDRVGFSSFNKKRNFDEIDRSGFSGFNRKRNFDEIDRSGFSGFNKKRNFDEIDRSGFSGFNRKRNFDEIDRSGFSSFNKRNFDEIDRSGVPGFAKRSARAQRRR